MILLSEQDPIHALQASDTPAKNTVLYNTRLKVKRQIFGQSTTFLVHYALCNLLLSQNVELDKFDCQTHNRVTVSHKLMLFSEGTLAEIMYSLVGKFNFKSWKSYYDCQRNPICIPGIVSGKFILKSLKFFNTNNAIC